MSVLSLSYWESDVYWRQNNKHFAELAPTKWRKTADMKKLRHCHPMYTCLPLFNAAKFCWRPLLECRAVTMPRRETRWNLQGCPKLANRSQPLVGRSSPYYDDMWRRYRWCLTSFFPIVDTCLSCEDTARQICAMEPTWRFLRPVFAASRVQYISDMHSKFALRPLHVWKYGRHPISDRWD